MTTNNPTPVHPSLAGKVAYFTGNHLLLFPKLQEHRAQLSEQSKLAILSGKLSIRTLLSILQECLTPEQYACWLDTPLTTALTILERGAKEHWLAPGMKLTLLGDLTRTLQQPSSKQVELISRTVHATLHKTLRTFL